jgi:hypothetical protein
MAAMGMGEVCRYMYLLLKEVRIYTYTAFIHT